MDNLVSKLLAFLRKETAIEVKEALVIEARKTLERTFPTHKTPLHELEKYTPSSGHFAVIHWKIILINI